jgi:peroxiredoxin
VELPRLQPLYETYKDRGFSVVAIEYQRDTERATAFIEQHGLTYTLLENGEDDDEVVRSMFQVSAFPTSFLVDREGRILYYHLGFEAGDEKKMAAEIERVLEL